MMKTMPLSSSIRDTTPTASKTSIPSRALTAARWTAALSAIVLLGAGCQNKEPAASGGKPKVVATTGMIADLARSVAGELAEVEGLMGAGVDPHLYKASESDVRRLAEADLVLYNGLFLEGKMGDILGKLGRSRPVLAIAEGLPAARLRTPPEFQGHPDPHVWFDVELWSQTLPAITTELQKLLPAQREQLSANSERVRAELLELDAWAKARIQEIPADQRVLVTAHDAFGYFGQRYGLEVHGIQGISTVSEAGLRDVEKVVELVAARRIKAIFVESSVPQRTIEAVQAAVREKGHEVRIGGSLYSDAMGAPGTPEGTYLGMVRHNVDTIVEALR
jgi:manganese/zinc/iron transport system substrate-binding protein